MKNCTLLFVALIAVAVGVTSAHAQPLYWDTNAGTAGAGATPNGTWNAANTNWNPLSGGGAPVPAAWISGRPAVFSAGTDAVNVFTVTLGSAISVGGITVEEGTPTISGANILTLTGATIDVAAARTFSIASVVDGSVGLSKTSNGTLVLSGALLSSGGRRGRCRSRAHAAASARP